MIMKNLVWIAVCVFSVFAVTGCLEDSGSSSSSTGWSSGSSGSSNSSGSSGSSSPRYVRSDLLVSNNTTSHRLVSVVLVEQRGPGGVSLRTLNADRSPLFEQEQRTFENVVDTRSASQYWCVGQFRSNLTNDWNPSLDGHQFMMGYRIDMRTSSGGTNFCYFRDGDFREENLFRMTM